MKDEEERLTVKSIVNEIIIGSKGDNLNFMLTQSTLNELIFCFKKLGLENDVEALFCKTNKKVILEKVKSEILLIRNSNAIPKFTYDETFIKHLKNENGSSDEWNLIVFSFFNTK